MVQQLMILLVILMPFAFSSHCPEEQPSGECHEDATCFYGQECCCGSCYSSFVATCSHGKWKGMYTDACYGGCFQADPTVSPSVSPITLSSESESTQAERSFTQITFNELKKLDACSFKGTSRVNKPMTVEICKDKCLGDELCKGITYDNDFHSCYICDSVDVVDFMHERDIYTLDSADSDCVGTWSACTSSCEQGSERVWEETHAPSGQGEACPDHAPDCQHNEDACIKTTMKDVQTVTAIEIFLEYEQTTIKGETINKCGNKKGAIDTDNIVECEEECRSCQNCVAFVWYYDDDRPDGPRCVMKRKAKLKELHDDTFFATTYVLHGAPVTYANKKSSLFTYDVLNDFNLLDSLALIGLFSIAYQGFRYVSSCCLKGNYAELNEVEV